MFTEDVEFERSLTGWVGKAFAEAEGEPAGGRGDEALSLG